MLYPNIQLDEVNAAFGGLKLTKAAILDELKAGGHETLVDGVEAWSPHNVLVDTESLREKLAKTALDTAYVRYRDWHAKLVKKPYSRHIERQCPQYGERGHSAAGSTQMTMKS